MTLALIIAAVAVLVLAREKVVQWRLRRYRQAMRLDRGQVYERTEGDL